MEACGDDADYNIGCDPSITVQHVRQVTIRIGQMHEYDRRLMQQVGILVAEYPTWVWQHGQIYIHARGFSAYLTSGERTNKFAAQLDGDNNPRTALVEPGWQAIGMYIWDNIVPLVAQVAPLAIEGVRAFRR